MGKSQQICALKPMSCNDAANPTLPSARMSGIGPSGRNLGAIFGRQAFLAFGYTLFRNYKDPCDNWTMARTDAPSINAATQLAEITLN